jgi:hypothetical protein
MRNAGVILTVTNTLMAEIAQDWSTPTGQQLITLLFADAFPAPGAGVARAGQRRRRPVAHAAMCQNNPPWQTYLMCM